MTCAVLAFVIFFVLPIGGVIWENRAWPAAEASLIPAVLLIVAVVLLPRLLRPLRRRQRGRPARPPAPRMLAGLDWPGTLSRTEFEAYCAAWLRAHDWEVTLGTDPAPEAEGVCVVATRGATTVAIMCDHRGEDFNPAIIRTFRLEAETLGATHPVLLTLARGPLPHPSENAAREAGVRLLRVAELPQLDALAAATPAEPAPAAG